MRPLICQLFVRILRKLKNPAEVREDVENINARINKRAKSDHQKDYKKYSVEILASED